MPKLFERYTPRAKLAIYHARYEALRNQRSEILPKDIVIGLTRDAHQPGCPFEGLYLDAEKIGKLLEPDPFYGPPTNHNIPLSVGSKKVVAYAALEANRDKRYSIGSDHLLRGVLRLQDETATIMDRAGYSLPQLRATSLEAHRRTSDGAAPFWWRFSIYKRQLILTMGLLTALLVIFYLR